jgi:predicted porin
VVLYGVVDAGLEHMDNGQTVSRLSSGIAAGSRWGLRGTEDLGAGWRAVFVLESRIELDNGTSSSSSTLLPAVMTTNYPIPGPTTLSAVRDQLLTRATSVNSDNALFDRQAFVGLITPVGGFLMGRMYTPGYEIMNAFNAYGDATVGQMGQGYSGMAIRASNAISQSGFTGTLMYSFGGFDGVNARAERTTVGKADDFYGVNLRYTADWWDVGAGYNHNYTPQFASATSGAVVDAQRGMTTWNLGASVKFGDARVFGMVMQRRNPHPVLKLDGDSVAPGDVAGLLATLSARQSLLSFQDADLVVGQAGETNMRLYHLGLAYRLGAGTVAAAYNRADDKRTAYNADVHHYSLGYFYDLSRRTTIYSVVALADNKNKARMGLGAAGYSGGFTRTFGQDSRAIQMGVRHIF